MDLDGTSTIGKYKCCLTVDPVMDDTHFNIVLQLYFTNIDILIMAGNKL